jgi:hypothetical protein
VTCAELAVIYISGQVMYTKVVAVYDQGHAASPGIAVIARQGQAAPAAKAPITVDVIARTAL